MSGTTSVPQPTFGPAGFIMPSESAILAGVQADLNAAFGGNLIWVDANGDPLLETPEGQLATTMTAIIADCYQQFLSYTTQVDPAFSSGRMQDGIARIYFITRMPATATVVSATLTGAAGTVIPAGAQAADTGGNIYALASAVTIGAGGTVTGQFVSQVTGPIACAAGSLTQIYQAVPGWESVVNTADGVVGSDVETRAAFEARRAATVAGNSVNNLQAIRAAVLAVPGVLDCYATENDASSAQTIGGVSLAANSVYVCVVGGASMAVAQAIWSKKAPGCAYNGTTTVAVTDSSYSVTPPSYNVSFTYATPVPVYFNVQIANSTAVPSDAMAQIQNAILGAFAGEDGGSRAAIGQSLYASRFYAAVAALGAWAEIISIQVGTASPGAANYVTMNINQIPSTSAADITVTLV